MFLPNREGHNADVATGTAEYGDAQVEDCKEASCSQGCSRSHAKCPHGEGQVLHAPQLLPSMHMLARCSWSVIATVCNVSQSWMSRNESQWKTVSLLTRKLFTGALSAPTWYVNQPVLRGTLYPQPPSARHL